MRLEAVLTKAPPGLGELIADLGTGENGFGGTPVATGELTVEEYIQRRIEMTDVTKLRPGYVPQTIFWAVDEQGNAIGIVRVRHYLNERLKDDGAISVITYAVLNVAEVMAKKYYVKRWQS